MVWSLWLTFESDGHWALGVTQDLLDDFPFQDQPEPKWSAGAGDDRRKVGAAELSNLGRVALVPISDLARILMFICINVFFTALLYRKLFPNPDHCNHQSFSQASLEITFPKERKKPFLAGKKFTLIITTLTRCAAMKGEVVKLGLKTLSRGRRRRSLSNFKLIRAQTNNLITHKLLSQNGRKFSLFSYF